VIPLKKATPPRVRELLSIATELAALGERLPQVATEYPSLAASWRRRLHSLRDEIEAQYPSDNQEAHRAGGDAGPPMALPPNYHCQRQSRLDACDD
jgi:hypothetical protein